MTDKELSANIQRVLDCDAAGDGAAEVARDIASRSTADDVFELLDRLEPAKAEVWRAVFANQVLVDGDVFPESLSDSIRDMNRHIAHKLSQA